MRLTYAFESIQGYDVNLTTERFLKQLSEVGVVLAGQSADFAPADGKLYALRDVTGTVPSKPLIASSIMSKKLAAGAAVRWCRAAVVAALRRPRAMAPPGVGHS